MHFQRAVQRHSDVKGKCMVNVKVGSDGGENDRVLLFRSDYMDWPERETFPNSSSEGAFRLCHPICPEHACQTRSGRSLKPASASYLMKGSQQHISSPHDPKPTLLYSHHCRSAFESAVPIQQSNFGQWIWMTSAEVDNSMHNTDVAAISGAACRKKT